MTSQRMSSCGFTLTSNEFEKNNKETMCKSSLFQQNRIGIGFFVDYLFLKYYI